MPQLQCGIQLTLTQVKSQLEELRDLSGADSMSEVVRRAVAAYDLLVNEATRGTVTVLRDKDGSERQLQFL
jgi:hypothetical protein